MVQMSLIANPPRRRVVNVASIPQRSPFRYPGGKTWLVPWIRMWLGTMAEKPRELVEPFAGGGIVSLTAVCEGLVETATMVEIDEQVGSIWQTILSEEHKWLVDRILTFNVTPESVQEELTRIAANVRERAFQTLLKNRVNHGGILAPGSGLLKYGENGKGLRSRWYPETLVRRIRAIQPYRDRLFFVQGDGLAVMAEKALLRGVVYFIDPPYTVAGKKAGTRLYTHNDLNHEALFETTRTVAGDFLMTYDNAQGVVELAERFGFDRQAIVMKNTHHAEMTELLIGRDLSWGRM